MAHMQKKRPFPKALFSQLTKTECEHFIEVLHFAAQSESVEDVKDVLARFQDLFPFTRVIGGLAKLSRTGAFEGFTNVLNVSYPEEWIRLYWQKGYFEVDPVLQTALQKPGTQHWESTYKAANSDKQREFMAAAKEFGLGDGITTGSTDTACESEPSVHLPLLNAWMQNVTCRWSSTLDTTFILPSCALPQRVRKRLLPV